MERDEVLKAAAGVSLLAALLWLIIWLIKKD